MRRIAFELNGQDCGHLGGFDKNDWTRNSVPYGNEPFFFFKWYKSIYSYIESTEKYWQTLIISADVFKTINVLHFVT